jgi:hypothetical protein
MLRNNSCLFFLFILSILYYNTNCSEIEIAPKLIRENLTSVVFLVKVCNYIQQTSVLSFKEFWYGKFAQSLETCTLNNVVFMKNENMNIVVEQYIPCVYTSSINSEVVDNRLLNKTNFNYYNTEWMHYLIFNSQVDYKKYKYKLLIYPQDTPAIFYGLATWGCNDNGCYSWYNTKTFENDLFLHELGHNFGLEHARTIGNEYGDTTCVMGNIPNGCYNSPHRYILGWDKPVQRIFSNSSNEIFTLSHNSSYVRINTQVFVEALRISSDKTFSLHVYWLYPNLSSLYFCKLTLNKNRCIFNHEYELFGLQLLSSDILEIKICMYQDIHNDTFCIEKISDNVKFNKTYHNSESSSFKTNIKIVNTIIMMFIIILFAFVYI